MASITLAWPPDHRLGCYHVPHKVGAKIGLSAHASDSGPGSWKHVLGALGISRLTEGSGILTQLSSSSSPISARCQGSLVEQTKVNVTPSAQVRPRCSLASCSALPGVCPSLAGPFTPLPLLPSRLSAFQAPCPFRKSFLTLRGRPLQQKPFFIEVCFIYNIILVPDK